MELRPQAKRRGAQLHFQRSTVSPSARAKQLNYSGSGPTAADTIDRTGTATWAQYVSRIVCDKVRVQCLCLVVP
jgi:hypothetical protein